MKNKNRFPTIETFTARSGQASEAAEAMARADGSNGEARAAYSRLLVEQSKSFGAYVSQKIGTKLKRAV